MRNSDRPFYRNAGLMRTTTPRAKQIVSDTMENIRKAMPKPPTPTRPAMPILPPQAKKPKKPRA